MSYKADRFAAGEGEEPHPKIDAQRGGQYWGDRHPEPAGQSRRKRAGQGPSASPMLACSPHYRCVPRMEDGPIVMPSEEVA